MSKRQRQQKISEVLATVNVVQSPADVVTITMIKEWSACHVPELSALVVHLRHLAAVHQTNHWIAKSDAFYADHQLFQRLYEAVVEEIDSVAERAVGLGSTQNVDLALQTSQMMRLAQGHVHTQTIPQDNDLAKRSLSAEIKFSQALATVVSSMKQMNTLSRGTDNLLAAIADKHETHTYLLKQRCS